MTWQIWYWAVIHSLVFLAFKWPLKATVEIIFTTNVILWFLFVTVSSYFCKEFFFIICTVWREIILRIFPDIHHLIIINCHSLLCVWTGNGNIIELWTNQTVCPWQIKFYWISPWKTYHKQMKIMRRKYNDIKITSKCWFWRFMNSRFCNDRPFTH